MNTNINTKRMCTTSNHAIFFKADDLATKKQEVIKKIYAAKSHDEFNNLVKTHGALLLKKQGFSFFDNKLPHSFQLALLRKVQIDADCSDIKTLSKIDLNKMFGQHLKELCENNNVDLRGNIPPESLRELHAIAKTAIENPEKSKHFEAAVKSLKEDHGVNSYFTSYDKVSTKLNGNEDLNSFCSQVDAFFTDLMITTSGHYYLDAKRLEKCNTFIKKCSELGKTTFLTKEDNNKYEKIKQNLESQKASLIETLTKSLEFRCQKQLDQVNQSQLVINSKLIKETEDVVSEMIKYLPLISTTEQTKIIHVCESISQKVKELRITKNLSKATNEESDRTNALESLYKRCKENIIKDYIKKMKSNGITISHSNAKKNVDEFWLRIKKNETYPPARTKFISLFIHPTKYPDSQELANIFIKQFNNHLLLLKFANQYSKY